MAINNITVNRSFILGSQLASLVESQNNIIATMRKIKSQMDNMTNASDWTVIEAQFGIPAGKGQTVYNLIAGALSELDADTSLSNLTSWITPS